MKDILTVTTVPRGKANVDVIDSTAQQTLSLSDLSVTQVILLLTHILKVPGCDKVVRDHGIDGSTLVNMSIDDCNFFPIKMEAKKKALLENISQYKASGVPVDLLHQLAADADARRLAEAEAKQLADTTTTGIDL